MGSREGGWNGSREIPVACSPLSLSSLLTALPSHHIPPFQLCLRDSKLSTNRSPSSSVQFWRQFFEMAANTRVPDAFSYNEHPSTTTAHEDSQAPEKEEEEEDITVRLRPGEQEEGEDDLTRGESSFMAGLRGEGGFGSSTPLVPRSRTATRQMQDGGGEDETFQSQDGEEFIMESPVERLGRLLRADLAGDQRSAGASTAEQSSSFDQSLPSGAALPPSSKTPAEPERKREAWEDDDDLDSPDASFAEAYSLDEYAAYQDQRAAQEREEKAAVGALTPRSRARAYLAKTNTSALGSTSTTAFGSKPATATAPSSSTSLFAKPSSSRPLPGPSGTPKRATFSTGTPKKGYTGLTNLAKTPLSVSKSTGQRTFGYATSRASSADSDSSDDEDYGDFLPPGMSPPVTMNFSLPPARGGRMVLDDERGAGGVVQGVLGRVGKERSFHALEEEEGELEHTFQGTSISGAAGGGGLPPVPGSHASQHSYHSSLASTQADDQSFDSDSSSSSSSDESVVHSHSNVYSQPSNGSYEQSLPNQSYNSQPSFAPSPNYPPPPSSYQSGANTNRPDVSSMSFNPNLTANDSLFAPLPPIPYPSGYMPSPGGTDEDGDTVGSMDPFGAEEQRRRGEQGRFGLFGTEGEMYTFNGCVSFPSSLCSPLEPTRAQNDVRIADDPCLLGLCSTVDGWKTQDRPRVQRRSCLNRDAIEMSTVAFDLELGRRVFLH